MSKLNLNPMADWGYVNNSRFRFLSIRNQGGGVEPVPPEPVIPTDRILYTVVEGGHKPESTWITENCSDNVFDESTGEGYLVLNEDVTELIVYYDEETEAVKYTIFKDMSDENGWTDDNIISVVIPTQITSIGDINIEEGVFSNYLGLTKITIPDSVTYIGDNSFHACEALTSIIIPDSVFTIGEHAFSECINLASVKIGSNVTTIKNGAFMYCGALASIIIPDSVNRLGVQAFSECINLASVTCLAIEPPYLEGRDIFANIATTTCYIPTGTKNNYEDSWNKWTNYFDTFVEIS